MNVYDAIMKRRTIRKFEQKAVSEDNLVKLVDCARVAAYGANVQPLKFMIVNNSETLQKIYPMTKWAGYLADGAPKENERPAAYIAVLGDSSIKSNKMYEVEAGAAGIRWRSAHRGFRGNGPQPRGKGRWPAGRWIHRRLFPP